MTSDDSSNEGKCLNCGHRFSPEETAGMEALANQENVCVLNCKDCGSNNILRVEPRGGMDEQPVVVVERLARRKPATSDVFDESVEPGTNVHPISEGKSA